MTLVTERVLPTISGFELFIHQKRQKLVYKFFSTRERLNRNPCYKLFAIKYFSAYSCFTLIYLNWNHFKFQPTKFWPNFPQFAANCRKANEPLTETLFAVVVFQRMTPNYIHECSEYCFTVQQASWYFDVKKSIRKQQKNLRENGISRSSKLPKTFLRKHYLMLRIEKLATKRQQLIKHCRMKCYVLSINYLIDGLVTL